MVVRVAKLERWPRSRWVRDSQVPTNRDKSFTRSALASWSAEIEEMRVEEIVWCGSCAVVRDGEVEIHMFGEPGQGLAGGLIPTEEFQVPRARDVGIPVEMRVE
jgi:hypothetical protein